jgi:ATP-dependent helicase/nuclease subunit B
MRAACCGLRPLDPLRPQPDAALRGRPLHKILDRFALAFPNDLPEDAEGQLMSIWPRTFLQKLAPWPVVRRLWQARMPASRPGSCGPNSSAGLRRPGCARSRAGGRCRSAAGADRHAGRQGRPHRPLPDGRIAIYDYKSGKPPTEKEERSFAKQLWLEAAMAADGAFGDERPAGDRAHRLYRPGSDPEVVAHDRPRDQIETLKIRVPPLLTHYLDPTSGFPSRRAVKTRVGRGITITSRVTANGTRPSPPRAPCRGPCITVTEAMNDATLAQVTAAAPDMSTWLSANAGSGKTRVLTDRVARLLL